MDKITKPIPESGMIDTAFDFWFNDREHIRSPFPVYIRKMLQEKATAKFSDWTSKISERAKKEINDEILAEKFEEILFETATALVSAEDEKLTILYPFMPRIGDIIDPKDTLNGKSKITGRTHIKRGDHSFLKVKLKAIDSGNKWETEFELPE
jgi:hypothetical protein